MRNLGLRVPGTKLDPVQMKLGSSDLEKSIRTRKRNPRGLTQLTWTRMVGLAVLFVESEILTVSVT